ncbi:ABC1 family-domain-containing protein [Chaetomium fimeti]|uniref:ABC1 family-domain-containing protein n=1 Tax=Chaetomium fimeti TaxID=1854472 RepID=A0AAE0HEB8_9PEZI|nr:ABC1 family-domain-containing protein [Chaetomium fimeti]
MSRGDMRLAFALGRLFSHPEAPIFHGPASKVLRHPLRPARANLRTFLFHTSPRARPRSWRTHRAAPRTLMATAGSGLAAATFVELSEKGSASPNDTGEKRMLEVSRAEIRKTAGERDGTLRSLRRRLVLIVDLYIWEPICTGFRFLQLVAIFVPVILTVPAMWAGRRLPERDNERTGTLWWYNFLVQAMEWAGPAFIKLGQWAASRSDIFPNELCDIMSKLHANAPAHSLHATKRILQHAFGGRDFDDIFDEFDEKPIGVGAIAQVYKAKLKPDLALPGDVDIPEHPTDLRHNVRKNVDTVLKSTPKRVPSSYVAIKVQHPRVERTVRRDLRIMRFFASVLNVVPTMEWLSLPDEVDQFGEMMKLQLDLRIEAANLSRFRKNFKERTTAWFPFPYTEFCTRNVLIEEFAYGIPLADFIANGGGMFQQDIASEGLDAFLRMLLLDNFVHADLHPGNIMVRFYEADRPSLRLRRAPENPGVGQQADVTEQVLSRLRPHHHNKELWDAELAKIEREGFRPQLVFIDTGLVTELNSTNRRNFLDLFRAVAEFDGYKAGHLMCERCRQPDAVLDGEVFALKMQHLVLGVKSRTLALGNVKIGDILQEVLAMVRQHHVRLEGDFVNVVISMLLLEGIGRSLNPDVDLLSSSLPILRQLGTQGGKDMVKEGDFHMLKVWVGLETRRFMQASAEDVERCVRYDLLSPNV